VCFEGVESIQANIQCKTSKRTQKPFYSPKSAQPEPLGFLVEYLSIGCELWNENDIA